METQVRAFTHTQEDLEEGRIFVGDGFRPLTVVQLSVGSLSNNPCFLLVAVKESVDA